MTDQQDLRARLPELPEPAHHYNRPHPNGILVNDSVPMFTADQMRAYALEAAAQLGRVGGRASVDEVHAWAERHDITGQYLVAAYEDAAASQLLAGVPDVELLDRIFNEEIKRVSTVEFDSNAICRKFYGELRKRLIEQKPTPQPANEESR